MPSVHLHISKAACIVHERVFAFQESSSLQAEGCVDTLAIGSTQEKSTTQPSVARALEVERAPEVAHVMVDWR